MARIMQAIPGVVEFSAAVRSCMIEYDQRVISLSTLLSLLEGIEAHLPSVRSLRRLCIAQLLWVSLSQLTQWSWLRGPLREINNLPGNRCTVDD